MYHKVLLLTLHILLLLALCGCKKEREIDETDILTSKIWKRTINDLNPSSNPQGEFSYAPLNDCDKDRTYSFSKNGTLTLINTGTKCLPDETETTLVKYNYNKENNVLTMAANIFTILEISESQIKFKHVFPDNSGIRDYVFILQ
ncbi:hypothetical protein FAZ15_01325 [Sphingobacterium olei]|uniref:Lipocalin-like domain-containing protein n=1 Tax=Sphingobacterium olei TaxID=2571155 RepID=A0A4U0P6K0_9SPHI|nr:hypothetical protein [Sphingobacterium olei]TJZ62969.1 hypothetical protein FAZ15_01325 [Sphingobacterium olei]